MLVQDYPVTTPFGWVAGYPLNQTDPVGHSGMGFHNGIDYGCPTGTPVIVNGVTIGLSNNTGATTGSHCHVGKYVGAQVEDPGVGNGFKFNSAVVYDIGQDSVNGIYVRITGDGALWNYLHLESTLVTKGQVLQGETMNPPNGGDVTNAKRFSTGVPTYVPSDAEIASFQGTDGWNSLLYDTIAGGQVQVQLASQKGLNKQTVEDYISKNLS